jgi:hypothetical protein
MLGLVAAPEPGTRSRRHEVGTRAPLGQHGTRRRVPSIPRRHWNGTSKARGRSKARFERRIAGANGRLSPSTRQLGVPGVFGSTDYNRREPGGPMFCSWAANPRRHVELGSVVRGPGGTGERPESSGRGITRSHGVSYEGGHPWASTGARRRVPSTPRRRRYANASRERDPQDGQHWGGGRGWRG